MLGLDNRGVTSVVSTVLLVAVVVIIGSTVGVFALGFAEDLQGLTAPATYGENLIENPGFENGNANWEDGAGNPINAGKIVGAGGVDGSNAVRLESTADGSDYVEQKLDSVLLPDAEYRLCARSRLNTQAGGQAWIGVQHADGGPENHLAVWEVTWTGYRDECEYFKAYSELENIVVWGYTYGDVSVSADDFVLQRTRFLTGGSD